MESVPKTKLQEVDEYLASQPEHERLPLEMIRRTIKNAIPSAEEVISYQMPAFKFNGMIAWYAASKKHYAIYMRPKILIEFKDQLTSYGLTKSTIQFSYNQTLPEALIAEMVTFAAQDNLANKIAKDAASNSKPKGKTK